MSENKPVAERVTLLEFRMDKAEDAGKDYRKSLTELSVTLTKLSRNIDQIKWVVLGAVLVSSAPSGVTTLVKFLGM